MTLQSLLVQQHCVYLSFFQYVLVIKLTKTRELFNVGCIKYLLRQSMWSVLLSFEEVSHLVDRLDFFGAQRCRFELSKDEGAI